MDIYLALLEYFDFYMTYNYAQPLYSKVRDPDPFSLDHHGE